MRYPFEQPSDPRFAATQFIVEATLDEATSLWERHNDTVDWESDSCGNMIEVGELSDGEEMYPVIVHLTFTTLNGVNVLIYHCSSLVAHWGWAKDFVMEACGKPGHCNAMNFHQCLRYIKDLTELESDRIEHY